MRAYVDLGAGWSQPRDCHAAPAGAAVVGSLPRLTATPLPHPQSVARHEVYDCKTDVWSFGVMLAELVTGTLPYEYLYMTPVQVGHMRNGSMP